MGADPCHEEFDEIVMGVGPWRRELIAAAARGVAADIRADAELLGTAAVDVRNRGQLRILGALPEQSFGQSLFWRYQLAAAADALATDTENFGAPIPRCTGEEMVLHLILRRAAILAGCPEDRVMDWPDEVGHGGWGDLFEDLFQDHDVLMLYEVDEFDPDARCVNLAPRQWFTQFSLPYPVPARDTTLASAPPENT